MSVSEAQLVDAIADATRLAVSRLFAEHPDEHFYYVSIVSTGDALPPVLTAWSKKALAVASALDDDPASGSLRWSYADSPYYAYGYEEFFGEVRRVFAQRPVMSDAMSHAEWMAEYHLRLRAMESAMARLDGEGLYGRGTARLQVAINAEVMPPDTSNTLRALRLNPPEALIEWLRDAEKQDEE